MDQTPKTSFIPKQSIGVAKTRERRTFNVFTFIAMVIFLSVVTLSVAVFFYRQYVSNQLELKKHELTQFKAKFGSAAEENIREIRLLEDRFTLAEKLLDEHVAVTELFEVIEERTQENAFWSTFAFERFDSGEAQLTLNGKAESFNTVALQQREFNRASAFKEDAIEFSKVTVEQSEDGGDAPVTFDVLVGVDTEEIAYQGMRATSTFMQEEPATTTATTTP